MKVSDHGEDEHEHGQQSDDVGFSEEGGDDTLLVVLDNVDGSGLAGECEDDDEHKDQVLHI